MKIGIDAKWFFNGPPSGRTVVRNIIKNIADDSSTDEFYIFLNKDDKKEVFPYVHPNIHLKYVWAKNNLISNLFILPFSSWNLNLDVLVFQNFSSLFSNCKRYVIIYDVLFKTHPFFYRYIERLYLSPLKFLANFGHRFCTISESERQSIIREGYCKPEAIDVTYLGVDNAFIPRERYTDGSLEGVVSKYTLPPKFILYVGRLDVRKNISNLIKALPKLKNSTVPLVIVGGNIGKTTDLGQLISGLGVENKIIFTGHVSDYDLPRIFALASVFCFVSYAEAFGLPPLEAMASGVPVVVSNKTCLPEICGEAALYADPDNPDEIASKIDQLLDDRLVWQKKKELGLMRAQTFTWKRSVQDLLSSIKKVVNRDIN